MRRMGNGNKAAMKAAFADMRKAGEYMFDCAPAEKIVLNDLVEGKLVEYDFD